MTDPALVVGYLASACSVTSFVPQVWKIIKTGNTTGLSRRMYAVTVTGFALWTAFGVMRMEWPIILTNAICFCLAGFILLMKSLPRRRREALAARLDPDR